ncbi:MAG TPA: hypothetical protein VFW71_10215 [Actinomycetota bacterium]|nr:hypothetical protein [Actinomycetota bacterium]
MDCNVPAKMCDGVTLPGRRVPSPTDQPGPAIVSAHPYNKDNIPAAGRNGKALNIEVPDAAAARCRQFLDVERLGGAGPGRLGASGLRRADRLGRRRELVQGKVGLDGVSYLAISQ